MASRIQSFQDLGGEILAKHTELLTAFRTCAESYMASATPPQPPAAESIPYAMFLALGTYRPFGSSCPANGPVLAILRAEDSMLGRPEAVTNASMSRRERTPGLVSIMRFVIGCLTRQRTMQTKASRVFTESSLANSRKLNDSWTYIMIFVEFFKDHKKLYVTAPPA